MPNANDDETVLGRRRLPPADSPSPADPSSPADHPPSPADPSSPRKRTKTKKGDSAPTVDVAAPSDCKTAGSGAGEDSARAPGNPGSDLATSLDPGNAGNPATALPSIRALSLAEGKGARETKIPRDRAIWERANSLYATSGSDDTVMESVNKLWFSGVRDDHKTVVVEECAEECIEVTPSDFFQSKEHLPWHQGPKRISLAKWWFKNPLKRHYRRFFFSPLQKPGEISVDEYNSFRGLAIPRKTTADAADRERSRARAQPVLDHILHIWCQRDPKLYDHVLKWLAWQVQHPGKKTGVLLILCGPHGAGKGIVFEMFLKVILGKAHYRYVSNMADLTGLVTGDLSKTLFAFLDESDAGAVKKKQANILKTLVTQEEQRARTSTASGGKMIPSFTTFAVATNDACGLPVETTERRYFILDVAGTYAGIETPQSKAYFDTIKAVLPEDFADVLYSIDLTGFNPRQFPVTAALRRHKTEGMSGPAQFWMECLKRRSIIPHESTCPTWPSVFDKTTIYQQWQREGPKDGKIKDAAQFWKSLAPYLPPSMVGDKARVRLNGSTDRSLMRIAPSEECRKAFCNAVDDATFLDASPLSLPA